MKDKKLSVVKKIMIGLVVAGFFFNIDSGLALAQAEYTLLEPLPFASDPDGSTNAATYIPGIFRLVIALSGALAVIKLIFGGITYMSSDAISGKREGKDHINSALLGLGLVIVSWLILYSLNPRLVEFDLSIEGLRAGKSFDTNLGGIATSSPGGVGGTGGVIYSLSYGKPWPYAGGNDTTERDSLRKLGIDVKEPSCTTIGPEGCTSVAGINPRIGPALSQLEKACGAGCVVTITGGTEYWLHGTKHSDILQNTGTMHRPGGRAVDIRKISGGKLDAFIMSKQRITGSNNCSNLGTAYRYNGAIYVNEGNHWHVCIP